MDEGSFASECKERSLVKELVIGPNISAEGVILTFAPNGTAEVMREAPFAYIPDPDGWGQERKDNESLLPNLQLPQSKFYHQFMCL